MVSADLIQLRARINYHSPATLPLRAKHDEAAPQHLAFNYARPTPDCIPGDYGRRKYGSAGGGLVATLTAFVWNPLSLYVIRSGLSGAEAGFLFVASAIAATMRVKPRETELADAIPSTVAH